MATATVIIIMKIAIIMTNNGHIGAVLVVLLGLIALVILIKMIIVDIGIPPLSHVSKNIRFLTNRSPTKVIKSQSRRVIRVPRPVSQLFLLQTLLRVSVTWSLKMLLLLKILLIYLQNHNEISSKTEVHLKRDMYLVFLPLSWRALKQLVHWLGWMIALLPWRIRSIQFLMAIKWSMRKLIILLRI